MASADLASLYGAWWNALRAAPEGSVGVDPLAVFRQALDGTVAQAPQLFGTVAALFQPWLTGQQGGLAPLIEGLRVLTSLGQDNLAHIGKAWGAGDQSAWQALLGASASASSPNPLAVGAQRTFGAFADALGMRPMRELQDSLQSLAGAEAERRAGLAAYLGVVSQAFGKGSQQFLARLAEMAAQGEEITSLIVFVRLWAQQVDGALQEALQSEAGLAATAQAMRASTQRRVELQRLVALASTALNVPTRAEVDDAFREIQQLKRELRRLRKAPAAQPDEVAPRITTKAIIRRGGTAAKTRKTGARP